ncbi:MAG: Na+/H+ antiporter NhaA [Rickettsiales bacterium]
MVIKYFQDALQKFMQYQASGGILLLIMTILALIFANSNLYSFYHHFLEAPITLTISNYIIALNVEKFVNDGLMAIFFLLVTLEIKREMLEGQLSSRDQQILPVIGAIGGVVVPALIYVFFNIDYLVAGESSVRGWAIPSATDIAFALGVASLLGKRVPTSLKAFLTALAIIDDLIAILIIAFFYNTELAVNNLLWVAIIFIIMLWMNSRNITRKAIYLFLGVILWALILESGVHATIAGVLIALTIPLKVKDENNNSPLKVLEHALAPWCAFLILPVFAFCNAGISFANLSFASLISNPVSLGILAGLFIGKQFGVFTIVYLLIKSGLAKMPQGANWAQIYGVATLTGIGFTMSIFIGNLAFPPEYQITNEVRAGILAGSLLSSILGYAILHFGSKNVSSKS